MKSRLVRLWPLGLFLAAALVAICVLWPALPEAMVLQGPDGYPDLSRPSFLRRVAWWLAKGPSCMNHDELLRVLLPSPLSHEWSYVLSSALLALAVGAYLRAIRLPVAACFAGGLAMAFSCYHFTLVNAGHRGYLTMMPYAAALFALVETAARRPRPAAFALMGVCVTVAALIGISRLGQLNHKTLLVDIEMDAILAVAIGGNSLGGGKFKLIGSIMGAYIIQMLTTTLYAMNVNPVNIKAYKAIVIIVIVAAGSPVIKNALTTFFKKHRPAKAAAEGVS